MYKLLPVVVFFTILYFVSYPVFINALTVFMLFHLGWAYYEYRKLVKQETQSFDEENQ